LEVNSPIRIPPVACATIWLRPRAQVSADFFFSGCGLATSFWRGPCVFVDMA
jgi:hypothetical protein